MHSSLCIITQCNVGGLIIQQCIYYIVYCTVLMAVGLFLVFIL